MRLVGKEFDGLFNDNVADWSAMAYRARAFLTQGGGQPTLDDIKKVLEPLVEVDARLQNHMVANRALGKHWIGDFTDYILDRVYTPTLPPAAAPQG